MSKDFNSSTIYTFTELLHQEDFNIRVTICKPNTNLDNFIRKCEKSLGKGIILNAEYYIVKVTIAYNDLYNQKVKYFPSKFIPGNEIISIIRNFENANYITGVRIELNSPTQIEGQRVWLIVK